MGYVNLTGLKGLKKGEGTLDNNAPLLDYEQMMLGLHSLKNASASLLSEVFKPSYSEPVGVKLAEAGYGNSVYDVNALSDRDLENLNEVRAANLPGILQLGNGALKFATTGITTFLNGTVGLLYGLGTGAFNALGVNGTNEDGSSKTFLLGLWDNAFNKAMTDIQDSMEEIAPNYYSQEELNSPWYSNILSANFLGDKLLKNMGFTVGALGAMATTGGIGGTAGRATLAISKFALGNAGKALGASRGTLAGINSFSRGAGQLAHHLVLTAVGASGEASIEAINAVKEGSKDAYRNLEIRRLELLNDLDPNDPDYYMNLNAIDAATDLYKKEIDSKFRDAGNSVFGANLAILSVSNFLEFAPIIKGGFLKSSKLADHELRANGERATLSDAVLSLLRGEPIALENTVNKGWGRTLRKAAGNALTEGGEEAAQNLASNSRQLQAKARLNDAADDTILGKRINPEATEDLVDYTKAFTKALYDNFGHPESKGWEEFFLGAITGGVGFIGLSPHTMRDAEGNKIYDPKTGREKRTWKPLNVSDIFLGGILGARRELNEKYDENQLIIDAVNAKLSDPEFIKRTQHAIASKTLADEMEAALQENDMVAFKNSEIGKLAEDVFFFRENGLIDEYKAIYEGLTNIDDKTLLQLYAATSDEQGNTALAEDDIESVRADYQGKAKRNLEKIKMILDYYDFVDLEYRDRSPLFKQELAYLYVRLDDTRRRIQELEEKKKLPSRLKAAMLGMKDYFSSPVDWNGTFPSRDAYIQNVESQSELTESEEKDLKTLKRQEKDWLRRIDRARKNPASVDWTILRTYYRAKARKDSLDAQGLTSRLKNALSVAEINDIIGSADLSIRLEVLNNAYLEGDSELKEKLQAQISASTAYSKTIKRLEKAGYSKKEASELEKSIQSLLFRVYIDNGLNLQEVEKTLKQIKLELLEDSVDTIAKYLPANYGLIEGAFVGEENKDKKGTLLSVLDGAIEDVGTGIVTGEVWKVRALADAKAKQQQLQAQQLQQQQEALQQQTQLNFSQAVENSVYVKQIENVNHYLKEIEAFGVLEVDNIIKESLEALEKQDDKTAVSYAIRTAKSIISNPNPQLRAKELENHKSDIVLNVADGFLKSFKKKAPAKKKNTNSFLDTMKQIKLADKNKDAKTVLELILPIADDYQKYVALGATSQDIDYIQKLWNKYKDLKLKVSALPYIDRMNTATTQEELSQTAKEASEAGIPEEEWIGAFNTNESRIANAEGNESHDISAFMKGLDKVTTIEQVSAVVLAATKKHVNNEISDDEMNTISQYATKRLADIKDTNSSAAKESLSTVPVPSALVLTLLLKFYTKYHINQEALTNLELTLVINNFEKVLQLISSNKTVPLDLLVYADVVLEEKDHPNLIITLGESLVSASSAQELNGMYRGFYEVGNKNAGTANLLQEMKASKANEQALIANYETPEHAEQVQWCVDNILKDILKAKLPIKIISTVDRTYNTGQRITYTAVKATDKIKAKAKNRWLVTTNDGQYIIIGTLGYNSGNQEQLVYWESIRSDLDTLIAEAGVSTGYWVSTNNAHTFTVNNIGDGRPIKEHFSNSSTRSIVELIEGSSNRNPQNFTLKNLKWQIIYTDEPKSVNVSTTDRVRGEANLGLGKVYVLVPTPSGAYYRHPVKPVTVDEIDENSKLFKKIDGLIDTIIKKLNTVDILALKGLLVLEKPSEDKSFLNIYFNDDGIRVLYTPREGASENSVVLSTDTEEAINQLKDIIYNRIRPFISVTLAHLSSPGSIKMLDEAGALLLKEPLAMFGYVGANYTIAPNTTVTNSKLEARKRSSLESQEEEIWYNGRILKKNGQYYKGDKARTLITDPGEIETLNDISGINEGVYYGEVLYDMVYKKKSGKKEPIAREGVYYFVWIGNSLRIYHKDRHGNFTKKDPKEYDELLKLRNKEPKTVSQGFSEKAVAGEDLGLDLGEEEEVLTPEEEKLLEELRELEKKTRAALEKKAYETLIKEDAEKQWLAQELSYIYKNKDMFTQSTALDRIKDRAIQEEDDFHEDTVKAAIRYALKEGLTKTDAEQLIEARKLDAVKRAIYDLELQRGIKVGDTVETPLATGVITKIYFSDQRLSMGDPYGYSDIPGTVVVDVLTDEGTTELCKAYDFILFEHTHKKINKQSQKLLRDLDNSNNSSTFVDRLYNSTEDTTRLEDVLYNKAASIAEKKGIKFDEDCTIKSLIEWYKTNVKFDLATVPSNVTAEVLEDLIDKCK